MPKQKIILAYSGGLDTSVILKWLIAQGYEVIAYVANIGQKENFKKIKDKALKIGASKVYIKNLKEEFVTDYIFPSIKANAIYEGKYLLGTAIARPLIAKKQVEIAELEKTNIVSHGATGKGNDQVRFELSYYALNPNIQIFSPWKSELFLKQFSGRTDLINYAEKNGINIQASRSKPYSEDENLMHISHEAGILEDPNIEGEENIYSRTTPPEQAPDIVTKIAITFKKGIPVKIQNYNNGAIKNKPLAIFEYLNKIGQENGIGRLDMVENRFVGIKSRGIYETPGATILHTAHLDIESITMDREVLKIKNLLSSKISELIYYGFWFSPEMELLRFAIDKTQENINGTVVLKIYKGNAFPIARESKNSLYHQELSSMDMDAGFNQKDAEGFIKINAMRLMTYYKNYIEKGNQYDK